jgi:AcrR family transcriptional regulator
LTDGQSTNFNQKSEAMARTIKDPDERRSELVASAQKLFFSKGYERTSVSDIVAEIGVAKGTFYYYFDSKQAILEAMIEELVDYSITLIRPIINDPALNATEKFVRAFGVISNWKFDNRSEILALLKVMFSDDNALLRYKTNQRTLEFLSPELTPIVTQGLEEGVFDTPFGEDAMKIALGSTLAFAEELYDVFLNPENYEDPAGLSRVRMSAVQDAIERILGAESGSLPFADPSLYDQWFDTEKEPNGR